jgi:hypothetical protein
MSGREHLSAVANRSLRGPSPDHTVILNLQKELQEERNTVVALEKERDFYFGKLRDIEVLIQTAMESNAEIGDLQLVKDIQNVLYSTEVCRPCMVPRNVQAGTFSQQIQFVSSTLCDLLATHISFICYPCLLGWI